MKEKFRVNCGEAPDLSVGLAFESHHALQQRAKIESRRYLRRYLKKRLSDFLRDQAQSNHFQPIRASPHRLFSKQRACGEQNESARRREAAFKGGKRHSRRKSWKGRHTPAAPTVPRSPRLPARTLLRTSASSVFCCGGSVGEGPVVGKEMRFACPATQRSAAVRSRVASPASSWTFAAWR